MLPRETKSLLRVNKNTAAATTATSKQASKQTNKQTTGNDFPSVSVHSAYIPTNPNKIK
jgi:hypothetical protein